VRAQRVTTTRKKSMKTIICVLLLLAGLPAGAAETLRIDALHSAVVFSWNHFGFSNPLARFEQIEGEVRLDANDLGKSTVQVALALDGVRTGVPALDQRLKSAQFFDAAAHPAITFKSTRVEQLVPGQLRITGELSMGGVTRPAVLQAKLNKIQAEAGKVNRAGFDAETIVRRSDFGLDRYVPAVSDEISVRITLEAFVDS
jgi:polyisoprenoid-binding protein YceI